MSDNKNASEPAFPMQPTVNLDGQICDERYKFEGLTKREWVATMAMQGMLANPELIRIMSEANVHPDKQAEFLSIAAVEQGDALLTELSKPLQP